HVASGITRDATSDADGFYFFPLLSPGAYYIRAEAGPRYQAREVHELELAVASSLKLDLRLRPFDDVWEQQQRQSIFLPDRSVLVFLGPDVDTSRSSSFEPPRSFHGAFETTVSNVIDNTQIRDLPLAGRDVYTVLVTQPGVAADAGTSRGLGLSVNGQRP